MGNEVLIYELIFKGGKMEERVYKAREIHNYTPEKECKLYQVDGLDYDVLDNSFDLWLVNKRKKLARIYGLDKEKLLSIAAEHAE